MPRTVTIYAPGKIDIHNSAQLAESSKRAIEDASISSKNKQLILDFLRDCELGKTVKNKARKRIGAHRIGKYASQLKKLATWLGKDFDTAEQKDIEELIIRLEAGKMVKSDGKPLMHDTKLDYKKCLRKFYKWLLGNNETYPELVSWIDTSKESKEIPALNYDEALRMVDKAVKVSSKAAIFFLFDSGARAEETLNIRLKDLTKKEDYYLVRIVFSKTKPRTISLPLCSKLLDRWLDEHPAKNNPEAQLFPMKYNAMRVLLNRIGKKALGKSAYPHLMRHSSATYYANKLSYAQLCYRYGWSMSSDMPNRYIDRNGLNELESVKAVKADMMGQLSEENVKLRTEVSIMKQRLDDVDTLLVEVFRRKPEVLKAMRDASEQADIREMMQKLKSDKHNRGGSE